MRIFIIYFIEKLYVFVHIATLENCRKQFYLILFFLAFSTFKFTVTHNVCVYSFDVDLRNNNIVSISKLVFKNPI